MHVERDIEMHASDGYSATRHLPETVKRMRPKGPRVKNEPLQNSVFNSRLDEEGTGMKLQTWLVISAIVGLLIGLTSIFTPKLMLKSFGLTLEGQGGRHFAQVAGAGILSLALVNWVARDYTKSGLVWGVVGANILIHVVTGELDLRSTLNKTFRPAASGWGSVAFHALFVGVFSYYLAAH